MIRSVQRLGMRKRLNFCGGPDLFDRTVRTLQYKILLCWAIARHDRLINIDWLIDRLIGTGVYRCGRRSHGSPPGELFGLRVAPAGGDAGNASRSHRVHSAARVNRQTEGGARHAHVLDQTTAAFRRQGHTKLCRVNEPATPADNKIIIIIIIIARTIL